MNRKDLILMSLFIAFGVLSRTIFHIGANIEFITAISICSGYFFSNKKLAFITVLVTMAISDSIIGNNIIFLFTWSGFFFGNLLGILLSKVESRFNEKHRSLKVLIGSEIAGIASTLIFFLWTNFGVVVTSNSYPKTFQGLLQSYVNGLPFLRPQFETNLIVVPLIFLAIYFLINNHVRYLIYRYVREWSNQKLAK